jgi:Domain of unknown function (DUF4878)
MSAQKSSFWTSLPAVLTAIAGLITAGVAVAAILIGHDDTPKPARTTPFAQTSQAGPTAAPERISEPMATPEPIATPERTRKSEPTRAGGSEVGPRETLQAYFRAVGNGNGAKACGFIMKEMLLSLDMSKYACARELTFAPGDADLDEYAGASANIVKVEENADIATVTMTDFEFSAFLLQREGSEWKISRFVE